AYHVGVLGGARRGPQAARARRPDRRARARRGPGDPRGGAAGAARRARPWRVAAVRLLGRLRAGRGRAAERAPRPHPLAPPPPPRSRGGRAPPAVLYGRAARLLPGAGPAPGIAACVPLVREVHGPAVATKLARRMVVPPHRRRPGTVHRGAARRRRVPRGQP